MQLLITGVVRLGAERAITKKAIAGFLNEAIRLDANRNLTTMVTASLEKGEYDKAIVDLTEAIRLDPRNAARYNNRGLAWNKKGDLDKAIADYKEAVRLNPDYAIARKKPPVSFLARRELPSNSRVQEPPAGLVTATPPGQFAGILDANDSDAKRVLATTGTGNLVNRQHAEAWMVLSSVALGMGLGDATFRNQLTWHSCGSQHSIACRRKNSSL